MTKNYFLAILLILFSCYVTAQQSTLVSSHDAFYAKIIGTANNSFIYNVDQDIWISDGSVQGTSLVGSLEYGTELLHARTEHMGKFYFVAGPAFGSLGDSLIEVDPNTSTMRTIISDNRALSGLVSYNAKLYIGLLDDPTHGNAFVSIDPESSNTEWIFDIGESNGSVFDAIVHNNLIYTIHRSIVDGGDYLSYSDGTAGSLNEYFLIATLDPGMFNNAYRINMTSAGNNLYFFYQIESPDYGLYVSDGTSSGTQLLKADFRRNDAFQYSSYTYRDIGASGDNLYFRGKEAGDVNGYLWTSDGSIAGTRKIVVPNESELAPSHFTTFRDELYFHGTPESFQDGRVFKVNDSNDGIELALDATLHPNDLEYLSFNLITHKDKLYMEGYSFDNGLDVYQSDGTIQNTIKVAPIPGSVSVNYASAGNYLFYYVSTDNGTDLYAYDPATSPTHEIEDEGFSIYPNPISTTIYLVNSNKYDSFRIYNASGALVKEIQQAPIDEISVSDLSPGIYFLKAFNNDEVFSIKFIKNN